MIGASEIIIMTMAMVILILIPITITWFILRSRKKTQKRINDMQREIDELKKKEL